MHQMTRTLTYALMMTGVLFSSGCAIAPDHDDVDRTYDHRTDDSDYREHQRREAYRHCREAGEHDCDDLLHRDDR